MYCDKEQNMKRNFDKIKKNINQFVSIVIFSSILITLAEHVLWMNSIATQYFILL